MQKSPQLTTIVGVLNDLMFTVKIQEAARRAGFEPVFAATEADALRHAAQLPALIILDLNTNALDPLRFIEQVKAGAATKAVPLLAFVSHVQVDLRRDALDRGCDVVLPRSAFSQNIAGILAGYAPQ